MRPPPAATTAFTAPSLGLLFAEPLRAMFDLCAARLKQLPHYEGDGHPVVLYPGLGAGPLHTSELRTYLRSCRFLVHDWERGVNTGPDGPLDDWLEPLAERVRALHADEGRRVSLVGWSLGGVYAREIAKRCPQAVRQVVTLATPAHALGHGNHARTVCQMLFGDSARLTPELQARLAQRPPVPTTSIYSRSDGLVSWRGCLEPAGPQVENVEVHASHLGMASHPEVLRAVADRLAQPEGGWRPYRRPRINRASRPSQ